MKNPNETKGKLLKIGDAAALLHISSQTLRDWTEQGKISAVLADSGHRSYYEADVRKLALEEKGITGYWTSALIVAMDVEGSFHYASLETYDTEDREATSSFTSFSQYWNFRNGLAEETHNVVLADGVSSSFDGNSQIAYPIVTSASPHPLIAITASSHSYERGEAEANLTSIVGEVREFLKNNFAPKVTYNWFNKLGQEVKPD